MSTMSDRELLELAAKAAGYQIDGLAEPECLWLPPGSSHLLLRNAKGGNDVWNPLTDDGDCLRLVRALKMCIDYADCSVFARYNGKNSAQEWWGGDSGDEAHAVLRVAAEIAQAMP